MEPEDEPLEGLADAVLEGHPVDWASADSTPDAPDRDVVRQLKVLAGIAALHRTLADEAPATGGPQPSDTTLEHWGRLKILERIGRGSFGDVYRAWDSKLDREVAVKLLHAGSAQPEGATVLREARLLARVRHPNVAIVFDADEIEGRVGLWMEFIHGHNLEQALKERGALDDREVTRIGIELCRALSAVHDAGLVHRDIKAQNLMQAGDGRLVLMDFGTGRELEETPGSTVDAAGTPLYLAPEIFDGAKATVRSDIYSAGVLLFHLLTGGYPVRGATIKEVGESHAGGRRLDLLSKAPGVNKALLAVVGRAIETDPSKRFGSARDMLAALETVQRRPEKPRRAALIAAGFVLATILVGAVAWLSRGDSPPGASTLQALPFHPRDWVLVAGFENRTGDKLFDGTLDYALGLELSNSRHVNVVTRERIGDALRLMRKPENSPVDARLAREVCLRDGGIRALLTGRVETLGSRYLVSVELVDPRSGTRLVGFREESPDTDGCLAAIQRISDRVRSALGEAPAPSDSEAAALPKVTTNNLKALQLYAQAENLMRDDINETYGGGVGGGQAAIEELLRSALSEDPAFASAWILLAFAMQNQGKPKAEVEASAATALRLSESTTERERYFIRASYHQLVGERAKAVAAYEALLAVYPDDYWAANVLAHIYDFQFDPLEREKALQVDTRLAEARPNDFFWNWGGVFDRISMKPDKAGAELYIQRANALVTPEITARFPILVSYLKLVPFTLDWVEGNLASAAHALDEAAAQVDLFEGRGHDCLAVHAALGYLTLGKIDAATKVSEKIFDPLIRNDVLAQIAFLKGDQAAFRDYMRFPGERRKVSEGSFDTTLVLQARAGVVSEPNPRFFPGVVPDGGFQGGMQAEDDTFHAIRGVVALARGKRADAIRELEEGVKFAADNFLGYMENFYLCKESLALALEEQGDLPRAIEVLERHADKRDAVVRGTTGAYWLRNRLQLAKLYRSVGRLDQARVVETELASLLAFADPDHPILVELRRLQET